jgi:hypothetical protein
MASPHSGVASDAQAIDSTRSCTDIGDMLVLADEAPTPQLRARAWINAGAALREAGQYGFALEQLDRALAIEPGDPPALTEKGLCLQGLAVARAAGHSASPLDPRTQHDSPRQVLLFSGHMMDAPDRSEPRFPADMEPIAAREIAGALDALDAGPKDVAFSQAAAGGDLLFVEACQQRGVHCRLLLPFAEAEFVQRSLLPSAKGDDWVRRFNAAKARLQDPLRIMPEALGEAPEGIDPFERCNLWLLYSALACGVDKVRFLALWNGGGADGPGGTKHMYEEVRRRTGRVTWLDVRAWR